MRDGVSSRAVIEVGANENGRLALARKRDDEVWLRQSLHRGGRDPVLGAARLSEITPKLLEARGGVNGASAGERFEFGTLGLADGDGDLGNGGVRKDHQDGRHERKGWDKGEGGRDRRRTG